MKDQTPDAKIDQLNQLVQSNLIIEKWIDFNPLHFSNQKCGHNELDVDLFEKAKAAALAAAKLTEPEAKPSWFQRLFGNTGERS